MGNVSYRSNWSELVTRVVKLPGRLCDRLCSLPLCDESRNCIVEGAAWSGSFGDTGSRLAKLASLPISGWG